jgi:hypothetical protein
MVCVLIFRAITSESLKCDNSAFLFNHKGNKMRFNQLISAGLAILLTLGLSFSPNVMADTKGKAKVYDEQSFLNAFTGKSRKQVSGVLGEPVKKEQSVKPSGADSIVAGVGKADKSKPNNVEMWYYNNIVTYDGKRTYKTTELTFVNDRVQNIGFINSK